MAENPDDEIDKYDYGIFSTYPQYIHIKDALRGVEALYRLYKDESIEEEAEDPRDIRYIKIIDTNRTNSGDIPKKDILNLGDLKRFIPSDAIKEILMSGEDELKLYQALTSPPVQELTPSPVEPTTPQSVAIFGGDIPDISLDTREESKKTRVRTDRRASRSPPKTRSGLSRSGLFRFGSIYLHDIFKAQNKVIFTPNKSERVASNSQGKRTIQIENLPNFKSRIGVGGIAMLFRYFQFLDAVHDLCDSNRGVWGISENRISTYRNLGKLYSQDIRWMLNNDYGGRKLYPIFEFSLELDFFLQCICLKKDAKKISDLVFWNYKFITDVDVVGFFKEPEYNDNYIPTTSDMVVKTTYLLKEYLNIEKRNPDPYTRDKCSNSLYNGLADVIGTTSYIMDAVAKTPSYMANTAEIIYQSDAESNKTKLCGVMQKICDATGSLSRTTVKYSPNAITSEYDAAWAQASNSYINRLSNKPGQSSIIEESSPDSLELDIKCHDISLMNIVYGKTTVNRMVKVFSALIRCVTGAYYTDILKNEILTKDLIEAIKIFHNRAKTQKAAYYNSLGKAPKKLAETFGFVKILRTSPNKTTIVNDLKWFLANPPQQGGTIEFITLEILRAYSLNSYNFYTIPNSKVPFSNTNLGGNSNTSFTSSVRAITEGEHYLENSKLISNHKKIKECKDDALYRCWFKSFGDLGQILEFHTKTRHRQLSYTFIPIFLTFDRLCADLSIFFNQFTILEEQGKDTGLTFYKKTKISGFGKVNYMDYNRRMYNKQMYNKRRYNISKRLKLMSHLELKNKLKSVGIKITKNSRGKRKYLTRKELENKALLFNKLQNTAKRMKIKIMYKRNGLYKYKTYKRLQKEINSKYNVNRRYKKPLVRNFNFG
jgi:hypothetical protein